jgi:hypothetical protein
LTRELVAEAAKAVCIGVLGGTEPNNFHLSRSDTERTPLGHMLLELYFANPKQIPLEAPKPRSISLIVFDIVNQERIMGTCFPLVLETDPFRLMAYYYLNPKEGEYVSLVNGGKPEPLNMVQRRKIRRGTRWLFANMLRCLTVGLNHISGRFTSWGIIFILQATN